MSWPKGKKRSLETINKIRARAVRLGKKHSPETIARIRAAMRGKKLGAAE